MTETTSEILNRAADEIEKYGWTTGAQGWYRNRGAGLCIEGGILAAMGTGYNDISIFDFWSCPAYRAVESYLGQPADSHELYVWNDMEAGSKERVIEVLRGAALVEASKEEAAGVERVTA